MVELAIVIAVLEQLDGIAPCGQVAKAGLAIVAQALLQGQLRPVLRIPWHQCQKQRSACLPLVNLNQDIAGVSRGSEP